jgi:ATP-dependent helicase Lhr and Lhr-like helicase
MRVGRRRPHRLGRDAAGRGGERAGAGVAGAQLAEVHAFGADDRGWHLLAVLERLGRICGRPLQRVGLSATVGNPEVLFRWLQGSAAGKRPAAVVSPDVRSSAAAGPGNVDLQLDYVGSIPNAAKVIASLHHGEKRLVFCDSKRYVEMLGAELRERGVTTHLVHASLLLDERRRAEQAFTEGRDCVIVSTSALELGVDVGDLDRVVQVNARPTVAGFLQRLGRSDRRPGTQRNCLSSQSMKRNCFMRPGCSSPGAEVSSSPSSRRLSRGTSSPSSCSRSACRRNRWA